MISIRYPGFPSGVDFNGISGAFSDAFDRERGFRQERQGIDAFGQYLDTMGGPGMSLAALGRNDGDVQRAPLAAPTDVPTQRVAQAHAASGGLPSVGDMTAYIAKAAAARGIDPGVAIRVAKSEGLAPNTWQSNFAKGGKREPSYGPYQLLVGGGETGFPEGMGNDFQKATGLDPSDPTNWQKAVDFALDRAAQGGWTPWYGAEKAGIGPWDGIRRGQAQQPAQVADASGGAPMPAQGGSDRLLPPRDVMMALFRSPDTRQLAVGLAQAAQKMRAGQNDPMAEIEYRKALLELRNLENPQPKAPTVQTFYGEDGREYKAQWDSQKGDWVPVGGSKLPSGMSLRTNADGTVELVQGAGAKFTESQSKDNVYSTRARGALPTLDKLEGALTSIGDRALDYDPTGMVRGRVQSSDYQVARAAGDEFLQAILRKDTGAAITEKEQELYGKTYLPQPGDGKEVIEYKREARLRAIAAIESGMTPAQMVAQEKALAASRKAPTPDGNRTQSGVQWSIEAD